ncbi:MAG: aminopeptidase P N-terminal domain-containing protein [Candidatus Baltobacteraceae bacterium]
MNVFAERRAAFAGSLGDAVAIIPGADVQRRNSDTEQEFRQSSDFYYLTGWDQPGAVLVIAPHNETHCDTLFTLPRDRSQEVWTGKRHGVEGALDDFGFEDAHPISEFDQRLPELLVGHAALRYRLGNDEAFDRRVLAALLTARGRTRRGGAAPSSIVHINDTLHEMRVRKSAEELTLMRRAGEITRLGHIAGMSATRPGMAEYELEAIMEYTYHANGSQHVAYPSIVAGGANATILHYSTNRDILRDGDLVLVDSGCEFDLYASDVTRTWPVNGRFSAEQRAMYEIVLAAQKAGIAAVRPGNRYKDSHDAAVAVLVDGLLDLGLLKGTRSALIESEAYMDYYYHNTGHWIGLDVHDVGAYREQPTAVSRMLEPGMTMTVEPGLYVPVDLDCDARFKGIGIRIEDDILCTADGPQILSAGIPKEIQEIEALVGNAAAIAH